MRFEPMALSSNVVNSSSSYLNTLQSDGKALGWSYLKSQKKIIIAMLMQWNTPLIASK
jgi:hypothetical protein